MSQNVPPISPERIDSLLIVISDTTLDELDYYKLSLFMNENAGAMRGNPKPSCIKETRLLLMLIEIRTSLIDKNRLQQIPLANPKVPESIATDNNDAERPALRLQYEKKATNTM